MEKVSPKGEYNIAGEVSLTVKVTKLAMLSLAARTISKIGTWIDDSYSERSQNSVRS